MRTASRVVTAGDAFIVGLLRRLRGPGIVQSMLLLGFAATVPAARAQTLDTEPADVAGNRSQPDYDAVGIRLGKLMVRPTLTVSPDFSSNVFTQADHPRSDVSVTVVPAIVASLSEPGANLAIYGEARLRRYARYSSQDDEQYRIDVGGSAELPFGFDLDAGIGWADTTAARGTVANDLTVGDPLKMREIRSRASIRKSFNRLYTSVSFSAVRSTYDDVELDDGTKIDQHFRNSRRAGGTLTFGYEVSPLLAIEVRAAYDQYRYSDPRPLSNRNADSHSFGLGIRYQVTQLLTAEFNAGLREHKFDNPLFSKIKGASLFGRLRWYPTPLISVRADLSQSTTTSTLDQVSAVTVTDFKLGADYEFRRNVLMTIETALSFDDYGQVGLEAKRL